MFDRYYSPKLCLSIFLLLFALLLSSTSPQIRPATAQGHHRLFMPTFARVVPGYPGSFSLSLSSLNSTTVRLTWTAAARVDTYVVWQATTSNMAGARAVHTTEGTSVDRGLNPGQHYFRVQAVNQWGASASNTVTLTIQHPTPTPSPTPNVCATIPGVTYSSLTINGAPSDRPAANHADLNLALRGYTGANAPLSLVDYNGAADGNAPQLAGLFTDNRTPRFTSAHRVYHWNWGANQRGSLITDWDVTLIRMQTQSGEIIRLPNSGYNIGEGYDALVLYATEQRITLKYTREDNVVYGYTIHLEDVCVEPRLLALYNQLNAAGRGRLPALRGGQELGRARSSTIGVAIRDTGQFMDPRSRKDWWRGR